MKRFALLLLLPLLLANCSKTYSWKQRFVVLVNTPSGLVSGAAISEVKIRLVSDFFKGDIGGAKSSFHGEAAVVKLPNGRYLFALLDGAASWVVNDLYDQGVEGGVPELSKAFKAMDAPLTLSPKYYPLLVTFGDVSDPASVMRVDPADLAATFGAGYALREITLEVTDDAVTEGVVEGVLGWWREYYDNGYTMNGEKRIAYGVNDPLADVMTAGVFKARGSK